MEIVYLGHASFRLKGKNAVVVTDPFDPDMVGLKFPKVTADIVTVSHEHKDHSAVENVKDFRMIIDSPGEYEVKGVSIIGFSSFHDDSKGQLRGKNTVFVIEMDNLRIAHLGDLGRKLTGSEKDVLGGVDILMIPVGGVYTIGPEEAAETVREVEPYIVLPMHYRTEGMNEQNFGKLHSFEDFLKISNLPVVREDKLAVTKESLGEEQKIVILINK